MPRAMVYPRTKRQPWDGFKKPLRRAIARPSAWGAFSRAPGPSTLTLQRRDGRRETRQYAWVDTVRANVEAFAKAIGGQAPYPFTDAEKIGNVAVLEAVCRSAAAGTVVRIA